MKTKARTGQDDSGIVRRRVQLVAREKGRQPSALDKAGASVGRFKDGPRDLSTASKRLDRFGK